MCSLLLDLFFPQGRMEAASARRSHPPALQTLSVSATPVFLVEMVGICPVLMEGHYRPYWSQAHCAVLPALDHLISNVLLRGLGRFPLGEAKINEALGESYLYVEK